MQSTKLSQYQSDSFNAIASLPDTPTLDQFVGEKDLSPCQMLILSILKEAFECLIGNGTTGNYSGFMLICQRGKMAAEALDWISEDSEELKSFKWCCYSLNWEPERIRNYMLKHADHESIELKKKVKFAIWQKDKKGPVKKYGGSLTVNGQRIEVGSFLSRGEASRALSREFEARGGLRWMEATG